MFGRIASAAGSLSLPRVGVPFGGFSPPACSSSRCLLAVAALPLLLNGDVAKAAIERQLTALTGGDFRYATLELKVWPRPTAELRQVTFRVAPVVEGSAERMVVRFALLRLLVGDVHVSRLRLEHPVLVVRLPAADLTPMPDDPVAYYRDAIGPAVAWLSRNASGLALSVRDGTVDLDAPGVPPLKLDAFTLDGSVSSDAVEVKVAARGNLWREARVSARIDVDSLAAKGERRGRGNRRGIRDRTASRRVDDPLASVRRDRDTRRGNRWSRFGDGRVPVAMPTLAMSRNGERLDLGAVEARFGLESCAG